MKFIRQISDVSYLSELIQFPNFYSQQLEDAEACSKGGLFIGNTHGIPFFLNFDMLMNPHVFVCGVTGSGKTYLIRSLVLRLHCLLDSMIVLVDFTGEYKSFISIVGATETRVDALKNALGSEISQIVYVNLKDAGDERRKVELAGSVFEEIIERMRKIGKKDKRVFVVIDEAWKLLCGCTALQTLLREGRKYKHGLIFSSQLIEDIDLGMLSNAATLFIFRLQNKQGLNKMASNYNLNNEQVRLIQNLGVGSCAIVQTNASKRRGFFLVDKVQGVSIETFVKILLGKDMEFTIPRQKFETVIGKVNDAEGMAKILRASEEKGRLELVDLVKLLVNNGVRRRKVLAVLRELGINEMHIADAFAIAVSSLVTPNENID